MQLGCSQRTPLIVILKKQIQIVILINNVVHWIVYELAKEMILNDIDPSKDFIPSAYHKDQITGSDRFTSSLDNKTYLREAFREH